MNKESEIKKRSVERRIKAYEIAKQISEFSTSYWEAMSLIECIQENFEWGKRRGKAELLPYPVDNFGMKVELPEDEASSSPE